MDTCTEGVAVVFVVLAVVPVLVVLLVALSVAEASLFLELFFIRGVFGEG